MDLGKPLFDRVNKILSNALTHTIDWHQWEQAGKNYGKYLEEDYGYLQIFGKLERRSMSEIYTDVKLLETPVALERFAVENLENLVKERKSIQGEERFDGLELVNQKQNLYVLGKPGSGKTTFLRYLAVKAAKKELEQNVLVHAIPIYIELRKHSEAGRSLFEAIEHELEICRFPEAKLVLEAILSSNQPLILLDGLDEVSKENNKRGKLIDEIKDFMRRYRESQFIISCRVATDEYYFDVGPNLQYVEMADFDKTQIQNYMLSWFDDKDLAEKCWQDLQQDNYKSLRELAHIPLLSGLLCFAYEKDRDFPKTKVEIYDRAIELLLTERDGQRSIQREEPVKDLQYKEDLLGAIAKHGFESSRYVWSKRDLTRYIEKYFSESKIIVDSKEVFQVFTLNHGIFIERSQGIFSFAHLSFQEYFTAKWFDKHLRKDTLEQLLSHLEDDHWREIYMLISGFLINDSGRYFFLEFALRIQNLVKDNTKIQQILQRVEQKVLEIRGETRYKNHALSAWFLYRTCMDLAKYLDNGYRGDGYEEEFYRSFNLLNTTSNTLDLVQAFNHSLALDHDLARIFDYALAHYLHLEFDTGEYDQLSYAHDYVQRYQNLSANEKENYQNSDLFEDLIPLIWNYSPDYESPIRKLKDKFEERTSFTTLMHNYSKISRNYIESHNLHEHETISALEYYLKAIALFNDCLSLAIIANPDSLKEQVFKPTKS